MTKPSMRKLYETGKMVRIPGQAIYKGKVYDVPPKGNAFRKATSPTGNTGLMFKATAAQLRHMMAAGHIPPARVSA